jgi:hypothetical protein
MFLKGAKYMTALQIARMNFIELLNEEFLTRTGYGAYAYLSTFDGAYLFDQFQEQSSKPAKLFVRNFVRGYNG